MSSLLEENKRSVDVRKYGWIDRPFSSQNQTAWFAEGRIICVFPVFLWARCPHGPPVKRPMSRLGLWVGFHVQVRRTWRILGNWGQHGSPLTWRQRSMRSQPPGGWGPTLVFAFLEESSRREQTPLDPAVSPWRVTGLWRNLLNLKMAAPPERRGRSSWQTFVAQA